MTASTEAIDRSILRGPVGRLLGDAAAEPLDWRAEALDGGLSASALRRVAGRARAAGREVSFSLVLKRVERDEKWAYPDEPERSWGNWRREPLLYASGLLDDLPGVRAPRCYGVDESEDGARLWLEDVADDGGWSLERFALAARQLGCFNGAYLTGRPVPGQPWLSRRGLRHWCEMRVPPWAPLPTNAGHPTLGRYWPDDVVAGTHRLIAECERFFDALDRLPQTFCHLDATRSNMLARGDETVLIDWAFAGHAAVGQEVAQTACASVLLRRFGVERLPELAEACFEGYLAGLREAGWTGDARLPRLGFCLDAALRHTFLPVGLSAPDPAYAERLRRATGHSFEENAESAVPQRRYWLARADEARGLMDVVW